MNETDEKELRFLYRIVWKYMDIVLNPSEHYESELWRARLALHDQAEKMQQLGIRMD